MGERISVYTYRDPHFAPAGDTVISVAPLDAVVAVYGGGGLKQSKGVSSVFGGSAYFRNNESGEQFLGIWGARNASKFRNALRKAGMDLEIVHEHPPARMLWWSTGGAKQKTGPMTGGPRQTKIVAVLKKESSR